MQPLVEGEVLCNPVRSFDDLKIGEQSAGSITYTFYKDRLYKIQIMVNSGAFAAVRSAFDDRYGAEKQVTQTEYGNALGARWKGSNVQWLKGAETITMVEGLGNGPGQVGFSGILFLDSTLQPPVNKPAANF